jgi:hypothetical protein
MNNPVSESTGVIAPVETHVLAEIESPPLPRKDPSEHLSHVPAEIRSLLSQPPLLATEDPNGYYALLDALGREVGPCGIIEWLLLKDIADLTWEIVRLRRIKAPHVNGQFTSALARHTQPAHSR